MSIVGVVVRPRAVMADIVSVVRAGVAMSDPMISPTMVARMRRVVRMSAMRVSAMSMAAMAVRSMSTPMPAVAATGQGRILPGTRHTNHRCQSQHAKLFHGSGPSL
jgi:hypothetical protein